MKSITDNKKNERVVFHAWLLKWSRTLPTDWFF